MALLGLWSCALIIAGCVSVIYGNECQTKDILFVLAINPPAYKIEIYHNLTLTCVPSLLSEITGINYQWHRISGQIPAKAMAVEDKLTIPSIVPEDQGQYYCTGVQFGSHCAESNHVTVETDDLLAINIVSNDTVIINKGGAVQFNASASGVGTLNYQWKKRGVEKLPDKVIGQNTSMMEIPNVVNSDKGQYYCVVTNMWNRSLESGNVDLTIYGAPTVTTHPSSKLVTSNMSITLDCDGNGTEPIDFYWESSTINSEEWTNISSSDSKKLVVKKLDDSEQYRCVVSNDAGSTRSKIAVITVLKIITHPQDKILELNSTISFRCRASISFNITFSWTHNGESVSQSLLTTASDTSILTITNVTHDDIGSYVCTVSSGSLSVQSNAASLASIGPPVVNDSPTGGNVPSGETILLTCSGSGKGTLVFSWERSSGGSWITVVTNSTSYTTNSTLAIGQYMYRCRATNEAGSVESNIATVNVYGPPTITTHPASQLTNVSISVTLDCEGTGTGSITYEWETSNINGGQWMTINNIHNKTLAVGIIEQSQQYRCVVSNEAGSTESNVATVTVLRITTQPVNTVTVALEDSSLNCGASVDEVTYLWRRIGGSVPSRSIGQNNNTLIIPKATPHDSGEYYCTVMKGNVSAVSKKATVAVDDQLTISVMPESLQVVSEGTAIFTAMATGIKTDEGIFTYQWMKRGRNSLPDEVLEVNGTVLTIPNVLESDNGFYYCIVTNEWNRSVESNNVTLDVYGVPVIVTHPTDKITNSSESVTLNCQGAGGGSITHRWEISDINKEEWREISDSDGEKLVIRNLDNSEKYRCVASNEAGSTISNTAIVTLMEIITQPTSPLTVTALEDAIFTCLSNVDNSTYSWHRLGSSVPSRSIGRDNNTFTIPRAIPFDLGRYYCLAEKEGISVKSNEAVLVVNDYLSINIASKNLVIGKGNTAYINATASGVSSDRNNFMYQWKKKGSNSLPGKVSGINGSLLTIPDVAESDEGHYYCTVTNEWSRSVESDDATLIVYDAPEIIYQPFGGDVPVNKSISLFCMANSLGTLLYSWERSSGSNWTTVSNDNTTSYTTDTTLAIGQYMYRCRVSNEAGSVVSNIATVNVYGPPTITTHPENHLINLSISVTLKCKGAGRGSITYQWETSNINGGQWMTISNNNNSTLVVGTLEESQQYRCVVSNEVGSTRSNVTTITVLKSTIQPINLTTVLALENVTLSCLASVGDVRYSWHRVDGHIPSHSQGRHNNTFTIHRITPDNEGAYYCVVKKHGIIARSNNAFIAVDDQLTISVGPTELVIGNGTDANFTATATGISTIENNFMYQWKKRDSEDLPSKVLGVNGTMLVIPSVAETDEGRYYCIVTNEWGRNVRSNDVTLSIFGHPRVIDHPEDAEIPIGKSITLMCRGNGTGLLVYSWERGSGSSWTTVSNDNTSYTTDTTLAIGQYMYRCRVSNDAGSILSNIATVNVYGPPTINNPLIDQVIEVNKRVTLNCKASGDGTITYKWQEFSTGSWMDITDSNNAEYTTDILTQSSQFRCVVTNEAGRTTSNVTIFVLGIIVHPEDNLIPIDSAVNLMCTATLSSNVIFSWTHNGISINQSLTTGDTSILTITNVRDSDAGSYVCTVSSGSVSVMSNPATLSVYGIPTIMNHPIGNNVVVGRSITLMCRANGPGILVYSWERSYGSNWTTVSDDNTTSYTTDVTLAIGQYMYRCRVSNEAGSVVSNIATVNVYGPPTITTHPASQLTNVSINVTLDCEGTGRGSITYRWETSNINGEQWMTISNSNSSTLVMGTLEQSQQYRCVVSNEAGSTRSNVATVTVLRITTHPSNTGVFALENITLNCSTSNDDVRYSWHRVDGHLPAHAHGRHHNTLVIRRGTPHDEGLYYCTAKKEGIVVRSDDALVIVYDKLSITITGTSEIPENITAQLTAMADGISTDVNNFKYQWKKRGSDSLPDKVSGVNTSVLKIPKFNKSDEGQYYCIVTNEWDRSVESNNATLTVFGRAIIVTHPNDAIINASQRVVLICQGSGKGTLSYEWQVYNFDESNWENLTVNATNILVWRLRASEKYRCIVYNEAGGSISNISTVTLMEIKTHPTNPLAITALEDATLTCLASVNDATYSWHRVDGRVPSRSIGQDNNTFTIPRVTPYDAGKYYCVAKRKGSSVQSNKAELRVNDHLTVSITPNNLLTGKGTTVEFTAIASGITTNGTNFMYQWIKRDSDSFPDKVSGINGAVLTIPEAAKSDEGEYYCIVTNEWGRSVESNDVTLATYDTPEIIVHPLGGDVPVNGKHNLTCQASGLGTLVYSWERNSGFSWTIVSDDNTSYFTDTVLAIGQYMYRCRVSNEAGSVVSNIATVNVYGPPTITTHPASHLTNVSISVTLDCGGTGRGSISYQWETSNINGGQWMIISNSNSSILVVGTLEQSQQYRCVASNEAGITRSNVATVTVLMITIQPINLTTVLALENVTLSCLASVDDVRYSWHRVDGHIPTHSEGRHNNTFTIHRITPHYEGKYYCVAKSHRITVISESAIIEVDDQLAIDVNPNVSVIGIGTDANFTATATGITTSDSNFMYQWMKRDSDTLPDKVLGANDKEFIIPNVSGSDEGRYYCIVTNEWNSTARSTDVTLSIYGFARIFDHPEDTEIPIRGSATLICRAGGDGFLVYSWERNIDGNWTTVSNDSATSYTTDTTLAIGQYMYRCRVSNEAGSVVSNIATVNVYGPPTINNPLIDQVAEVNERVTLNCKASGDGTITYKWQEFSNGSWMDITDSNNAEYTTDILTQSSQFRCVVTNEAGRTTSNVTIFVLEIITQPQDKLVSVNSVVNLTCASSLSSNVTFSWTHNGVSNINQSSSTTGDTSILTITNVRQSDAGSYVCTVSSGSVSVMSNTATLTVYGDPIISDHPTGDNVVIGRSITLICRASGLGILVYSWERSSGSNWTSVSNDNTTSYTTDTTLAIGQYMYRCRVSNEAGPVVSNIATVNVYGPPTITTHPASQSVNISMSVTLNCEGTGRGSITYQWETSNINGGQWMNISNSNSSTLVVGTLEQSQQYRCVVSNEAGSTRSNVATVTVLKIITQPIKFVTAIALQSVTLNCSASVNDVMYSWHRVDGDVPSNSHGQLNDTLTIQRVTPYDEGIYYCSAELDGISVKSENALVVVDDMLTTKILHEKVDIGKGKTASLTVMATGISTKENNFKYQWKRNDTSFPDKVSNINESMLIIPNVSESDAGQYYCIVTNEWDRSVDSEYVTLTVYGPPVITHNPRSNILATNGKIVTLICMGAGRGPITYRWEFSPVDSDQWTAIADSNNTMYYVREFQPTKRYRCVVSNEAGSTASDVSTITLLDVPDILKHPDGVYVPINTKFSLTCQAIGPGTLEYSWERYTGGNWTTVSDDNTTSYTTDITLAIGQYMYRCRVRNEAGSVVSNIATVNVYGPPTITTHPKHKLMNNSISVTFECEGIGNGSITYQWETSDINEEEWKYIADSNSSTFVFGTLKESLQYRCVVSNEAGSTRSNVASITILKISAQPVTHITGIALENVTLNCSASVDDVKYSWHRVGDTQSNRSIGLDSGTLVIKEATPHDEGLYYCMASKDGVTAKSDNSLVDIDDMLSISVMPSGRVVPIEGETLYLTALASGINTNNFEYQWRKRGSTNFPDKILSVEKDVLVIPDVSISDEGDYYCNVTNEWGRSVISYTTSISIEELPSRPKEFAVDQINIDSLQLTWRKSDEINHYIIHYYLTDQSEKMVNLTDFNGTYALINLKAYTEYNIYVTAISLSNYSGTPMKGMKSEILTVKTLAGEPVIDNSTQDLPDFVINEDSYATGTFTALLPNISEENGPFKHLYVVVINADVLSSTKRAVSEVKDIPTHQLIQESLKNDPDYYIAAAVKANQYMDRFVYKMLYILGVEDITTDVYSNRFYNRRLTTDIKYFCRIFSINSTEEYEISSNTDPEDISLPEGLESDGNNGLNLKLWMIVVPAALVALIIIILICIICLIGCKRRNSKADSELELSDVPYIMPSLYSTPSSNGRSIKDEPIDVEENEVLADQTDKAVFQGTAYLESTVVKTSIDQPTTLVVGMPDDIKAEITWKKDGEPINHPILTDGSLYIPNTHLSDEGVYTVNINKINGIISESLQVTVNDPRLPPERTVYKPVKVEDFTEHVASLKANNDAKTIQEFESLVINASFTQHAARLLCNKLKNRYKNIAPYDHSRVVLSQQDLTTGSDYINASHVDGYEEARAYIAAQAPTANTVDDFWRMIWEQNVSTIVMLTKMIEDNKVKCHRYWPNSGSNMYGNYKVTLQKEEILTNYCLRQFVIEQVFTSQNHVRVIQHLHFTAWPDHGVPKYATAVLEFQKKVNKMHKRKCNKPMLVHCSAGVGRSGTFIAIDTEIERMKRTAVIDVYNCVYKMRFWRNYMVQTYPQYNFIYMALLEHVTCGVTTITAPIENVEETVNELSTVNPRTYRTGFQLQFECLERDSSNEQDFRYSEATLSRNTYKNRNQKPLPPDAARVTIPQVNGDSDYINFCYIDGYDQGRAFLVGPGPMQSTASHFWTMVWEQKSYAIVMLGQLKEDEEEVCYKYWPSKKQRCEFEKFTIESTSEEKWDQDIVKRTFKLINTEQKDARSITQLQYVGWSSKICPNSSSPLLNLIDVLESIQRKTNNGPIAIHCSDGIGRSGTFCALMISIYEFKAEQKVDIFQIIKSMRSQRPGLVASANQYRFIHKGLLNMLKQYSPYFDNNDGTSV